LSKKYTNQEILAGICNRDRAVLAQLYQDYFPMVTNFVVKNTGTTEEAKDIFHDALTSIFEKTREAPLHIHCSFKTYLYAICKNLWLMVLRKKRTAAKMTVDTESTEDMGQAMAEDMLQYQQRQLYKKYFLNLGTDCQKILKLFLEGESLKSIADLMGFTEKYAKKRKYVCQKQLIEAIEQDDLYQELSYHS
jgi:RNA polymerase sigma factor (sigma-70 family)